MRSNRLLPYLAIAVAALLVGACGKAPLVPDAPRGPTHWFSTVAMACTTTTTDPSGAQVSYQFDWGDGNKSEWSDSMKGGVQFADTHSYTKLGSFNIKVRAKNSQKASGWSAPLSIIVSPAEGTVAWSMGFTDPNSPDDSSDFSLNSFAIGSDNTVYLTCGGVMGGFGAVIAHRSSDSIAWTFYTADLDAFFAAPVVADDGTIFVGCSNETLYVLNSGGTVKSRIYVGSEVSATGALAADGTAYFQAADSMVIAVHSDGTTSWTFASGGGKSAPIVGTDGTVYVANQSGTLYALDPSNGSVKWQYGLGTEVIAPPAIDPSRNALYAANDAGQLQSINLANGTSNWSETVGDDASGPVIGSDGSVYISGSGELVKFDAAGGIVWRFAPSMAGVVSTPALTVDGYVYVLVVAGKKRLAQAGDDSLYAVDPDGTRRWACGLDNGQPEDYPLSAPKVDASGLIYVGDGTQAWCVSGVSAPAQSAWPMFQHDAQNTGRAR